MNLFGFWPWSRSARGNALSLYKRGLACGERKDFAGAMAAYTSSIELPDTPHDVKAMALYNRALILAASGRIDLAVADLRVVMELPTPLHVVKLAAKRRLERLQSRQHAAMRSNGH